MPTSGFKHGDTPTKAMVRGTISYLEAEGLPVNKASIFRHFNLSRSQGYAALSLPASKRNDPDWAETRGRPAKISDAEQQRLEAILWDERCMAAGLNWTALAKEAGIAMECNKRTLHRTLGTMSYRWCFNCGRSLVHKRHKEKRCEYARKMLETPQNWRLVRFSGELHFGFGLEGRVRVLPRPGERPCSTCDQRADLAAWSRDVRKVHVWVAAGHGFKSEPVFYDDSTSANGAGTMGMNDYRDKVLEKAVKPWVGTGGAAAFVLEEDPDAFAHGGASKTNMVQQWKESSGLRSYFNCGESPDLTPLDALWPPGKQWAMAAPLRDWDDSTLRGAVKEIWAGLEQERINVWVDFMPQRLRQVLDSDGAMVPW